MAIVLATLKLEYPLNIIQYSCYALSALGLVYLIYTLILFAPKLKQKIKNFLMKFKLTNKMLNEYDFRTIIFASCSLMFGLAYAGFNLTIAILERSIWFGALAGYYSLLALMRAFVVFYHVSKKRHNENELEQKWREQKTYKRTGIMLILLPVAMSCFVVQMVVENKSFVHAGLMIYVSATYAFYKIIMAIINLIKSKNKTSDYTIKAVRSINFADALVSILALQSAMLKEFSGDLNAGLYNAITGAVVCVLTVVLGLYMIFKKPTNIDQIPQNMEND